MSYNLFLDDARQPNQVSWVKLPFVTWEIAKNYNEFVKILETRGVPDFVTFDHDLADEHYQEYQWTHDEKNLNKGVIEYKKFKEKTGYDCAKYLVEFCLRHDIDLPQYEIHTMNPVGKDNIKSLLESYIKFRPN